MNYVSHVATRSTITARIYLTSAQCACVVLLAMMPVGCCRPEPVKGYFCVNEAPLDQQKGVYPYFHAGAAKTDITPPPGYAMVAGGSGAIGVSSPLFARAIYLEDTNGNGLALVSCDLLKIPGGLSDCVAKCVGNTASEHPIPRSRIILAATGADHVPGNYFDAAASNHGPPQMREFDPALFDFLATRIADAIRRAVKCSKNQDAIVLKGEWKAQDAEPMTVLYIRRRLPDQPRNDDIEQGDTNRPYDVPETLGAPIATAAFVSINPRTTGKQRPLYDGGILGATSTLLENEGSQSCCLARASRKDVCERPTTCPVCATQSSLDCGSSAPVVAFFNGASLDHQVIAGAQVDPQTLAQRVNATFKPKSDALVRVDGTIRHRFGLVDLAGAKFNDDREQTRTTGGKNDLLAHDHFGALSVPSSAPIGIYRIGDQKNSQSMGVKRPSLLLAALPGEFTAKMGEEIVDSLRETADKENVVLLVCRANEYASAFTTPQGERPVEGAVLYGKYGGEAVKQRIVGLARNLDQPQKSVYSFHHDRGPRRNSDLNYLASTTDMEAAFDAEVKLNKQLKMYTAMWLEATPDVSSFNDSNIHRVIPRVSIQERIDGLQACGCDGAWKTLPAEQNAICIYIDSLVNDTTVLWKAVWITRQKVKDRNNDKQAATQPTNYRFVIEHVDGTTSMDEPRPGPSSGSSAR